MAGNEAFQSQSPSQQIDVSALFMDSLSAIKELSHRKKKHRLRILMHLVTGKRMLRKDEDAIRRRSSTVSSKWAVAPTSSPRTISVGALIPEIISPGYPVGPASSH